MNRRLPAVLSLVTAASLLLILSCTGLKTLPAPTLAPCAATGSVDQLWSCLAAIPMEEEEESAFRSTSRVMAGDGSRKKADQDPEKACEGSVPEGFSLMERPAPGPGRAPLHALYRKPEPGRPTIVVVHGLFDSKYARYVRVTAELLAARGFGVLVPDMRWHGCLLSREWLPSLGVEEAADLIAWSRLLEREPGQGESPIGLIGISLGGLDVIHAVSSEEGAAVFEAGAVALVPPAALHRSLTSLDQRAYFSDLGMLVMVRKYFQSWLRSRLENLEIPQSDSGRFASFLAWLGENGPYPEKTTPEGVLSMADPGPRILLARRPLLLISGGNDPVYPSVAAAQLEEAAIHNPYALFIETPGGGHIGQLGLYPEWISNVIVRFFLGAPGIPPR